MNVGMLTKRVILANATTTTNDGDGFYEALSPSTVPAAIQPLSPSGDGRTTMHLVTIRYHKDVSVDTRLIYQDPRKGYPREFFVRGVQNVDERNAVMQLLCEEVEP